MSDKHTDNQDIEPVVPQTEQTSKQTAKQREHVARTPQATAPESSAGALTGHTTERSIAEEPGKDGKVVAAHQTTVITDPNDPLAVQIPDHPGVDARASNPLAVHKEETPEQAFANGTAPVAEPQFADESNPDAPDEQPPPSSD